MALQWKATRWLPQRGPAAEGVARKMVFLRPAGNKAVQQMAFLRPAFEGALQWKATQ